MIIEGKGGGEVCDTGSRGRSGSVHSQCIKAYHSLDDYQEQSPLIRPEHQLFSLFYISVDYGVLSIIWVCVKPNSTQLLVTLHDRPFCFIFTLVSRTFPQLGRHTRLTQFLEGFLPWSPPPLTLALQDTLSYK